VVWQRSVTRGVDVVIGSELAQLLDCEDLFLEVMLDERHANRIQPGQSSRIRLLGGDEELHGTVRTIRGNTVSARDSLAVAQLERTAESQIAVTVAIDRASLGAGRGTFCGVGRTALVSFETPLSFSLASVLRRPADVR
jgi:multidrug resistance efflux pump